MVDHDPARLYRWQDLIYVAFSQLITISYVGKDWGVPRSVIFDAVAYRMHVAVEENIYDYHESLRACVRRLESAN